MRSDEEECTTSALVDDAVDCGGQASSPLLLPLLDDVKTTSSGAPFSTRRRMPRAHVTRTCAPTSTGTRCDHSLADEDEAHEEGRRCCCRCCCATTGGGSRRGVRARAAGAIDLHAAADAAAAAADDEDDAVRRRRVCIHISRGRGLAIDRASQQQRPWPWWMESWRDISGPQSSLVAKTNDLSARMHEGGD